MTEQYYEPELGQAVFGCAWGAYNLNDEWVERQLCNLSDEIYDAVGPEMADEGGSYGQEFKNNVFEMHCYYWGNCTCGYEEREVEWSAGNKHLESCYQKLVAKELKSLGWQENESGYVDSPKELPYEEQNKIQDAVRKKYCEQFGLSFPDGCAVHCTCDFDERWAKFTSENGHAPDCPIVIPNFRHFASGVEVRFYKYIGRGMSVNKKVERKEWKQIFRECRESLRTYASPDLLVRLKAFFGDTHFTLYAKGLEYYISLGLDFPEGVSDKIRDEDQLIFELKPCMEAWLTKLANAVPDYKVEWDAGQGITHSHPYWPSYLFPPGCGPEGPTEEYKREFPDYAALDEEAMKYYEWVDDPILIFADERWKAVRWAGINTRLILSPIKGKS